MNESATDRAAAILRGIPGVEAVATLSKAQQEKVLALELSHERSLSLPVRNLGITLITARGACLVVLKTARFRAPKFPSLYMVEEVGPAEKSSAPDDHSLVVAGKRYAIIGEEVVGDITAYSEPTIPLEGSFVIFPARRSGSRVPSFFLLPPLPFPELESVKSALGIENVMSISPSLVCDAYLRDEFGFSPSNILATVLIGFDSP
ncbi:MAG TPA: hypothetical protein VL354_19220 [Spirochaetia bacterium]|nr:hypothetical protein [Spirochaetia bacterium]